MLSSPIISRCAMLRFCNGLSNGPSATSSTGTSTNETERHRGVQQDGCDHEERHERTGSAAHHLDGVADMGQVDVLIETTSPVGTRRGSVAPSRTAWRATSCTVR